MKTNSSLIAVAILVAAAVSGGYLLGSQRGQPSTAATAGETPAAAAKARKLLYYRNPMGLPDTSPTPKKDPMGMDYIAVYAGEDSGEASTADAPNQVRISTEKIQKLGVRVETAALRSLETMVRAVGRVEPDEQRLFTIAPKFEGYVERLQVNVTGQAVRKGQPLFEAYSPELVSAQREYAIAAQGLQAMQDAGKDAQSGMKQLAESSLLRLKNWDISDEQLLLLAKTGEAKRTLSFRSPVAGIVTEKKAVQGMRFMPGDPLYQVADLSTVWVIADVFEQDIGRVKKGAKARIKINAYPDKVFEGRISYVYPTLKAETRTVAVRVELANPNGLLKPAMFAQVELAVGGAEKLLTVPDSAVIDSGTRRIVLVQLAQGRFEPREVKLGAFGDSYVEVLDGIKAGEQVVVAANFLIDAESNLKAAIGGLSGSAGQDAARAASQTTRAVATGHRAEGRIDSVDAKAGSVTISHGPVASLGWPAMTMDFKLANPALFKDLQPGASVSFEFVERQAGEWLITSVKPNTARPAESRPATAAAPHSGH